MPGGDRGRRLGGCRRGRVRAASRVSHVLWCRGGRPPPPPNALLDGGVRVVRGKPARGPAPLCELPARTCLLPQRRLGQMRGHGRERPGHEAWKLSDIGDVPTPRGGDGIHEPEGVRPRQGALRARVGVVEARRAVRDHRRAPRAIAGTCREVPEGRLPRGLLASDRDNVPLQLRLAQDPQPGCRRERGTWASLPAR